jgi:hypothetical protein
VKHSKLIICFPICLIILILFVACTKEGRLYTVTQEFKDYFLFQKESFWIYKNDSTNVIDSTYLTGSPQYMILKTGDKTKWDPTVEQYFVGFQSQILSGYLILSGEDDNSLLVGVGPIPNTWGIIDHLTPDTNFYINSAPHGYIKLYPKLPTIEINSIIYSNFFHTRFYNDEINCDFYFAKNIGLIKISGYWENKNQSWSLVRYHIVQ